SIVVNISTSSSPSLAPTLFRAPSGETRSIAAALSAIPPVSVELKQDDPVSNAPVMSDLNAVVDVHKFVEGLDKLREQLSEEIHLDKIAVGSTLAVTTGF